MSSDEIAQQLNAGRVLPHLDVHALRTHILLRPLESQILPDHDAWDFVQQGRAAAHRAGGEGRVKGATLIDRSLKPSGVFQAIHLSVMDDAAALHALVMAASDNLALAHQRRTDWDAAFRQPPFR